MKVFRHPVPIRTVQWRKYIIILWSFPRLYTRRVSYARTTKSLLY